MIRVLLFALASAPLAYADVAIRSLFQAAPLDGVWKHRAGDDPRWAEAGHDDSAWTAVPMPDLASLPPSGLTWYRIRVRLPDNLPREPLALLLGPFGTGYAYEIYFDGKSSFELEPGGQVTLVSDGVVEAASGRRELFGFDRTREISTKSAREIAEAAKAWGQNDDITVVTVRRLG